MIFGTRERGVSPHLIPEKGGVGPLLLAGSRPWREGDRERGEKGERERERGREGERERGREGERERGRVG